MEEVQNIPCVWNAIWCKYISEHRKVVELKNDGLCWYVSFVFHGSIIVKGWIDATFLQRLNHNKSVVIPSFVLKCLTQNVKMDHEKKFHKSLQTMQLLPIYRCKYTSKAENEWRGLYNFVKLFWLFRTLKQKIEWETRGNWHCDSCLFFTTQSCRRVDLCRTGHKIKNITSNYLWRQDSCYAGVSWKQIQCIWHANVIAVGWLFS